MRRPTPLLSALLLVLALLVPLGAQAAAGDSVVLHTTYRGSTPWVTSADVVLAGGGGAGTLAIDGRLGLAEATHPAPSEAGSETSYDLTDAVPVPADAPMTVTTPNGASVELAGATIDFGPGATQLSGVAGPGDEVTVTLRSGAQELTTTVTAAGDGGFTADLPAFDGTWEFGASITATVARTAPDDTGVQLHVTRRLPDADITTELVSAGPPATAFSTAVFTDITPGPTFEAVGEPPTVTLATATASFDPLDQDQVEHQGVTVPIDLPDLSVDTFDFVADAVTGTAPAGTTVHVLVASDAGGEEASTIADGDGAWRVDLAGDASVFAQVDAAIDHTDGARHHARGAFPEDATVGGDAVLAYVLLPMETLVVLPFAEGTGDTYELTAATPSGSSTASATFLELLTGLRADDFDPPVDLSAGLDLMIDQGGTISDVRVPALTWSIDAAGVVSGTTDPGQDVTLLVDVPVAGVDQRTVVGADDGSFGFTADAPFGPGSEAAAFIFPDLNEVHDLVFVIDSVAADPIEHPIGADGGRAPGLGNTSLTIDDLGLLAPSTEVPTAWRMDALVGAGGPADLAARFPAEPVTGEDGLLGLEAVTPLSASFPFELTAGGEALGEAPAPVTTYVPLNVDGTLGSVIQDATVLVDRGSGFEQLPDEQVTLCLGDADTGCDAFPVPYAAVDDAEPGTYAVVDDQAVPNTMTVDRVYGGPGTTRIETAVALSQATFPGGGADSVVIASSRDFPDALAATPLAAAANAPILLNPTDALHPAVEAEVERLGVGHAYVMGGTAALSRSVELALGRDAGVSAVTRVDGVDRFETAAEAARRATELWRAQGDNAAGSHALVALGIHAEPSRAWPDALVSGQLAGYAHRPILLTRQGSVPAATQTALADLGTSTVTVVGGTSAIPQTTADQLGSAETTRLRLWGPDRYATGTAIASEATGWGADDSVVLTATGLAFPDGLTAAAAAYHQGGVLLLAHGLDATRSDATLRWLDDRAGAVRILRAVGGPAAVSDAVLDQLVDAAATGATTIRREQVRAPNRSAGSARRVTLRS